MVFMFVFPWEPWQRQAVLICLSKSFLIERHYNNSLMAGYKAGLMKAAPVIIYNAASA